MHSQHCITVVHDGEWHLPAGSGTWTQHGAPRRSTVHHACMDALPHACTGFSPQIQAQLGEGHVNLVQARELLLTKTHLGLAMEFVSGGNLTGYVTEKWDTTGLRNGLFLTEDEARYIFKVRCQPAMPANRAECCASRSRCT